MCTLIFPQPADHERIMFSLTLQGTLPGSNPPFSLASLMLATRFPNRPPATAEAPTLSAAWLGYAAIKPEQSDRMN